MDARLPASSKMPAPGPQGLNRPSASMVPRALEHLANYDGDSEWLAPKAASLAPITRLIVLVPRPDVDESALARRVWSLAAPLSLKVVYVGLGRQGELEWHMRRTLASLTALTRDQNVPVQPHIAVESDWIRAVRGLWHAGDLVICSAELSLSKWGRRKRLGPALCAALGVPVGMLAVL